jgi:hypothetical protein
LSSAPAEELKQAIDDIDKARDVVDLLVVLLKICRRHASEVVAAGQDREMRRQIRQEAAQVAEKPAALQSSQSISGWIEVNMVGVLGRWGVQQGHHSVDDLGRHRAKLARQRR